MPRSCSERQSFSREAAWDERIKTGDERRRTLRRAMRAALRDSNDVAKELLSLSEYSTADSVTESGMSKAELACARSDAAACLFLVHSLAADLLVSEGRARQAAKEAADAMQNEDDEQDEDAFNLRSPLLFEFSQPDVRKKFSMPRPFNVANTKRSWWTGVLPTILAMLTALRTLADEVFKAGLLRWRIALKVALSFTPSFIICAYLFNFDSTVVGTAAYLCSYGSQYSGGSLRRSVLRGLGLAVGATFGSAVRHVVLVLVHVAGMGLLGRSLHCFVIFVATAGWSYFTVALYFEGGPYGYMGLVAAFSAVKILLCDSKGCTNISNAIMYNMYASFVTVTVELGVLPISAKDVLRSRLAAALAGSAAALSALVTSNEMEELPLTPRAAKEVLRSSNVVAAVTEPLLQTLRSTKTRRKSSDKSAIEPAPLPDLSDRLKEAGVYDKYLGWREGYLRWRSGGSSGAHGELNKDTAQGASESQAKPVKGCGLTTAADANDGDETLEHAVAAAFKPSALDVAAVGEQLDPFAGVSLPKSWAAEVGDPTQREAANEILLQATDGPSELRASEDDDTAAVAVALPATGLDPDAAEQLPKLAECLRSLNAAGEQNQQVGRGEPTGETVTLDAPQYKYSVSCDDGLPEETNRAIVSLADVQTLLVEIGVALAPAKDLAAQAEQRLDNERVDSDTWQSLAASLGIVRLHLSLLARIALRLGKGVGVTELFAGEQASASALVAAFGEAFNIATSAVAGGAAPSMAVAAKVERKLRDSSGMLMQAVAQREVPKKSGADREAGILASEVLAGTASHTLSALLIQAAEVLALAVVLAGPSEKSSADEGIAVHSVPAAGVHGDAGELPDLQDRLKEIGMHEKYLEWREGYLQWRSGGAAGAHKEILAESTT